MLNPPPERGAPNKQFQALGDTTIGTHVALRLEVFRRWWAAPVTRRDRLIGVLIGTMGSFWIGLLVYAFVESLQQIGFGAWALISISTGALLGMLFPKAVSVVCFPFSTFGGSVT